MPFPIYRTAPADVVDHASGWVPLDEKWEVPALALVDRVTGLFARCTYDDARAVAERLSAELLTDADYVTIAKTGLWIAPVIVRETPEERAERSMRGGTNELERMATVEWARREDEGIMTELEAAGWDGVSLVANVGKGWAAGAPPGLARNIGWDEDPRPRVVRWVQPPSEAHSSAYVDYSQLLRLKRRRPRGIAAWFEGILRTLWAWTRLTRG